MTALSIRIMGESDAAAVAGLATQLGYPSSEDQIRARLARVLDREDATALVAEDGGRVVAWIHVELRRTLVADERCRGRGIGGALLAEAERWARDRGARRVRVGSRTTREDAHRFYERGGYTLSKTSHWFEKELA